MSHAVQSPSTEVAPGIHRLTGGVSNFYLVEQSGGLTLVDAGTPGDWRLFLRTLAGRRRRLGDLEAGGFAPAPPHPLGFSQRARPAGAAGGRGPHDTAAGAVRGGATPGKNAAGPAKSLARREFPRTMISLSRRKGAKIIPVMEVSSFADHDVLDVPGKPRAVHTPGHTPGNAALYFEDQDALISGDTLITHNPLTGRTGPQIMPSGFNRDPLQALDSLSALEHLTAEIILPGHGEPWHGPISQAVQLARAAGPS